MQDDKLLQATKRGMAVLHPRMKVLHNELRRLQLGYVRLANRKHDLELRKVKVQVIPLGVSAKSKPAPMLDINNLDDAQALKMLEMLQARCG